MALREWHIWDFPDSIYVLIEDEFRIKLLERLYKRFGSRRKFCLEIEEEPKGFRKYHCAKFKKNGKEYVQYIPNKLLKKIITYISKEEKLKLEKQIIKIRVRAGTPVNLPKLPLLETPKLYSIIGHLIADGCQSGHHTPYYANSEALLRKNFSNSLNMFGEFESRERKTHSTYIIEFPKVITDIIQGVFDFQITHPNRIPQKIFTSTVECKAAFIAALFDDDGSVSKGAVLTIHSLSLMKQVKELLCTLNIETGKISIFSSKGKDKVSLNVRSKSLPFFKRLIPLKHPTKKFNLQKMIETKSRIFRTRNPILIEQKIFSLLEYRELTTRDFANELLFTMNGVTPHLNRLFQENEIVKKGYKNKVIWALV